MNTRASFSNQLITAFLIHGLVIAPSLSYAQTLDRFIEPNGNFCESGIHLEQVEIPLLSTATLAVPPTLPSPRENPKNVEPKRGKPRKSTGVKTEPLPLDASEEAIARFPGFREPIRPVGNRPANAAEDVALIEALNRFADEDFSNDRQSLEEFAERYPRSRWVPSVLYNVAKLQFDTGLFTKAMESWWKAWEASKEIQSPDGQQIADLSLAEYAGLNARVGRKERLEEVFEIARKRPMMDQSLELIRSAMEGYQGMVTRPEISFKCGPFALQRIASLSPNPIPPDWLEHVESPESGFSLKEVADFADQIGLKMQVVKRSPGSPLPEIAVVHWNIGHFAALVGGHADGFIIDDPTFRGSILASNESMLEEASGYFLVPSGPLPKGWSTVPDDESSRVFGKGNHAVSDGDSTRCNDETAHDDCGGSNGMATYDIHLLRSSLTIRDTPVWHDSPYGPSLPFTVIYNQREAGQPGVFTYTNFGPRWVSNWISYVEDDPASPGGEVTVYLRSGGRDRYSSSSFNSGTQTYDQHYFTGAKLKKTGPNTYERLMPDGSKQVYGQFIGTTGPNRRVFLTEIIDPWGNTVTLEYDQAYPSRISRIYDAADFYLELFYEVPDKPYLVSRIEDPHGRDAHFDYELYGVNHRLKKITDIIGIESIFDFQGAEINSLETPYGKTKFKWEHHFQSPNLGEAMSWIEAIEMTGPDFSVEGDRERVEFNNFHPIAHGQLPDATKINVDQSSTSYWFRNSFYWDKLAMKGYYQLDTNGQVVLDSNGDPVPDPNRYGLAVIYHWLKSSEAEDGTGIIESKRTPGQGRVWYNYPNQSNPSFIGSSANPTKIGRVIEDDNGNLTTSVWQATYTAAGQPSILTDEEGRKQRINYAANGVDITSIQALQSGTWRNLVVYANYVNHRPTRITTPGGVVTNLTLNGQGQVTQSITNKGALSIATTYTYDTDGRLLSVSVQGSPVAAYTYDAFGRVATLTDATGYTLSYAYDGFDRVTGVTHPDGSTTETIYQYLDPVATKDREDRWTHYQWNHRRQLISIVDPKSQVTAYQWCLCGSLLRLIDPKGQVTTWERDLQGRVTSKILPDGRKYAYTYQPYSGRLATVAYPEDAAASQTTASYAYHLDGQLAEIDYTDPAMADVTYTHNDFLGRLSAMTDGQGTTSYTYKTLDNTVAGAGQVATINGPWNHDTLVFGYDPLGRPLSRKVRMNNGTTIVQSESYTYDSLGRMATVTDDLGTRTVSYDGDSARPLTEVTTLPGQGGNAFLTRQYQWQTAANGARLAELRNRHGAAATTVLSDFTYGYSPAGELDSWQRSLGNGAGAVTSTWEMTNDPIGQLTTLVEKNGAGEVTKEWEWAYDAAGNRISEIEGPAMRLAGIGGANRLDRVGGGGRTLVEGTVDEPATVKVNGEPAQMRPLPGGAGYLYSKELNLGPGERRLIVEAEDGSTNKTLKSYSVTLGGVERTLTHDLNGNLVTEAVAGGKTRTYEWDAINRLTAIQSDAVPVSGSWRTEFTYDGQSRRVRVVEKTWNAGGGGSWVVESDHRYLWIGTEISQKRDASGTNIQVKYYGNGERRMTGGPGTDYHYTRDHLGSIREVVETDGDVYLRYNYTPWGERIKIGGTATTAESDAFEWGFTGHHYHARSGLHLALYRAYDANLGRWLSEDPLGEAGGLNLYGYVGNAPVNAWDPLGLEIVFKGTWGERRMLKKALKKLKKAGGCPAANIDGLERSDNVHTIEFGAGNYNAPTGNPNNEHNGVGTGSETVIMAYGTHGFSMESILAHELHHAAETDGGVIERDINGNGIDSDNNGIEDHEDRAVKCGNDYRSHYGEPLREGYNDIHGAPGLQSQILP